MTGRSLHDEPRLLFFFQALGFIDEYGRYSTAVPLTLTFFFSRQAGSPPLPSV